MNEFNLIRFNDDNHAERIFANGKYMGDMSDIGFVIENVIDIAKDLNNEYKFKETQVYVCDDFDDYDEDDEIIDNIWDFFNETKQMTEKQVELIFKIRVEIEELKNMKVNGEIFTTAINFAIKILKELLKEE